MHRVEWLAARCVDYVSKRACWDAIGISNADVAARLQADFGIGSVSDASLIREWSNNVDEMRS